MTPAALAGLFAGLVRHHACTPAAPLPAPTPGITWCWAANGVFKRGVTPELDILIHAGEIWEPYAARSAPGPLAVPGLAPLLPHARFAAWPGRIGGALLAPLLASAQRAGAAAGARLLRPVEKQFFIVAGPAGRLRLIAPAGQEATPGRVRYAVPAGERILVDIHSHHAMAPLFSATDDADDDGLSVSVVIGRIFSRPAIRCRLNVYGHRQEVPAALIFDGLGPFADAYPGEDADADPEP